MAKYWGTPPFITQNFFSQNDLKWLQMHFNHNFIQCNILTGKTFFLKASLKSILVHIIFFVTFLFFFGWYP